MSVDDIAGFVQLQFVALVADNIADSIEDNIADSIAALAVDNNMVLVI